MQTDKERIEKESLKEDMNELQNQINKQNEEKESLKEEISNLKDQIDKKEKEKESILDELKKIKNQVNKSASPESNNKEVKNKPIQILDTSTIDSLERLKKLGHGASSEVYSVIKKERYALKILDINLCKKTANSNDNDDDDDDDGEEEEEIEIDIEKMKRFLFEYEVMNQLDHPNVTKVFGFCLGDKKHPPSILLEYCPFNLKARIKKLEDLDRITVIIEISSVMKEVHKAGIIHRDLKLENILLDKTNHVKLCDFGICTLIEKETDTTSRTQMAGTLCFMAPEIIQGRKDYDEKVDVYSFGVVLYLILSKGEYPNITLLDVGNGKMAEIPESFTDFSRKKELIRKCWSFKSCDRPSFEEIYNRLINNKDKII